MENSENLKNHFWKERTFWSDGYFACSIGNVSKEAIERYIEEQS
ncbi:MAG: transposase, partial [Bacillota bacterium]|nr:transposase [Bacillota bacterium]